MPMVAAQTASSGVDCDRKQLSSRPLHGPPSVRSFYQRELCCVSHATSEWPQSSYGDCALECGSAVLYMCSPSLLNPGRVDDDEFDDYDQSVATCRVLTCESITGGSVVSDGGAS